MGRHMAVRRVMVAQLANEKQRKDTRESKVVSKQRLKFLNASYLQTCFRSMVNTVTSNNEFSFL